MQLELDYSQLARVMEDFRLADGNAQPLVAAAITNSELQVQRLARMKAPHVTGTLQRSILVEGTAMNGKVSVNVPYGIYVEKGTAPHDIYPKAKKALFWKGALNPYAHVYHPGSKAKPFFEPAVIESLGYIREQFQAVITRIMTLMGGL